MKIKICGLTSCREAGYLNENGVDFAGFVVFFPKSRRNVSLEQAGKIMACLGKEIQTVAVTVSPTVLQIQQIEEAGFDFVQIHGELSEEVLKAVGIPVLKAFNFTDLAQYEHFQNCKKIAGYVFDAAEPGSGKRFDWEILKKLTRDGKLFFLAGGLSAENVAEAIKEVHPDGVDVSSGVEYEDRPGKNPQKIREFCMEVQKAVHQRLFGFHVLS